MERYKQRHGYYPEAVLTDRINRNRENLAYCKKNNIRLSGPKLGKPTANAQMQKAEKALERLDARMRNTVEGKGIWTRSYLCQIERNGREHDCYALFSHELGAQALGSFCPIFWEELLDTL